MIIKPNNNDRYISLKALLASDIAFNPQWNIQLTAIAVNKYIYILIATFNSGYYILYIYLWRTTNQTHESCNFSRLLRSYFIKETFVSLWILKSEWKEISAPTTKLYRIWYFTIFVSMLLKSLKNKVNLLKRTVNTRWNRPG